MISHVSSGATCNNEFSFNPIYEEEEIWQGTIHF